MIVSRLIANYITFAAGEVLLLVLTICSLAAIFPRVSGDAVDTRLRLNVATVGVLLTCGAAESHSNTMFVPVLHRKFVSSIVPPPYPPAENPKCKNRLQYFNLCEREMKTNEAGFDMRSGC